MLNTNTIATTNELQSYRTIIEDWNDQWKMIFNTLKSEAFLKLRKFKWVESLSTFKNHSINNVQQHKHFTGIIWNINGTLKNHLTMVIN